MTSADAFSAPLAGAAPPKILLRSRDVPPVLLVFGLTALTLLWNRWAGLSFSLSMPLILLGPLGSLALCVFYTMVRPEPKIAETALYVGLWLFYPAFGAELTYLVTRLDFPLQDRAFMAWDQALGFDWMGWARFVLAHPVLKAVQDAAYSSCFWQPLAAIVIFAAWGPRGRNGQFLTSVLLGLLLTITVFALAPNIGPAGMHGVANVTGGIIKTLRSGFAGPYAYVGIIPFPSFHSVMAILFTVIHRDNRWRLLGFGTLNLVMLSAVPFQGDHYLCDILAGAVIAGVAFLVARWIYRAYPSAGPRLL